MNKTLFLCLPLLVVGFSSYAQMPTVDSLQKRVDRLEAVVSYMSNQLKRSGEHYTAGIVCFGIGAGMTTFGALSTNRNRQELLFIGGGIFNIVGLAFTISSHSAIGQSGRWKFEGDKIILHF